MILHPIKVVNEDSINYCYIIVDQATKYAAVINPAWELEKITGISWDWMPFEMILLTHSHHDHVDLVPALSQKCFRKYICLGEKWSFTDMKLNRSISFRTWIAFSWVPLQSLV